MNKKRENNQQIKMKEEKRVLKQEKSDVNTEGEKKNQNSDEIQMNSQDALGQDPSKTEVDNVPADLSKMNECQQDIKEADNPLNEKTDPKQNEVSLDLQNKDIQIGYIKEGAVNLNQDMKVRLIEESEHALDQDKKPEHHDESNKQQEIINISTHSNLICSQEHVEDETSVENQVSQVESKHYMQSSQELSKPGLEESNNTISPHHLKKDYVKRIWELDRENKLLKQRREERIRTNENQMVIRMERMLADEENILQQRKQMNRMQSEKALDDLRKNQAERQAKVTEGNAKYRETVNSKPLYRSLQEKFEEQCNLELEEKKKKLAKLREISRPMDFEDINQHQENYELKKKLAQNVERSIHHERKYEKPSYQSKIYEMYQQDFERQAHADEYKHKNEFKILERRKFFSRIVNENYKPKHSQKKEDEFLRLQEKIHTKSRVGLQKVQVLQEGNLYLRSSIENIKNSQQKKLNSSELSALPKKEYTDNDDYVVSKNIMSQLEENSKQKSILSKKPSNNDFTQNIGTIRKTPQNQNMHDNYDKLQDSIESVSESIGDSMRINPNKDKSKIIQSKINISSTKVGGIGKELPSLAEEQREIVANNSQVRISSIISSKNSHLENPDEKKRHLDFAKQQYTKQLGEQYMSQIKFKQQQKNEHPLKEEIQKKLEENTPDLTKKIDAIINVLKPFDEKIERDNHLLSVFKDNDNIRSQLADRYISSIEAKLSLIESVKSPVKLNHSIINPGSKSQDKADQYKIPKKYIVKSSLISHQQTPKRSQLAILSEENEFDYSKIDLSTKSSRYPQTKVPSFKK